MTEPSSLLREYVESGSEPAFRQLVTRYIDLVYSVALRRAAGDAHRAQDIAQTVFIDLARKAPTLPGDVMLGGWLHKHCCFVASTVNRTETRRAAREQEAAAMETPHTLEAAWTELAPALDDAIQQLDDEDRQAVILRFFERKDFRAIGEAMGASENAAQKRVARAIEKLRASLGQAGVALSGAALATLLSDNALAAAPAQFLENTLREAIKGSPATRGAAGKAAAGAGVFGLWKMAALFVAGVGLAGLVYTKTNPPAPSLEPAIIQPVAIQAAGAQSIDKPAPSGQQPVAPLTAEIASSANPSGKSLRLTVVTADSGQPIPNVPLEVRIWTTEKFIGTNVAADRAGFYLATFPSNMTEFSIITHLDGFADTRLEFLLNRGEKIPESYTLKLARGVRIGGIVLDPEGNPVPEARVGIGYRADTDEALKNESHRFGSIQLSTDAEGRWEMARTTREVLSKLSGSTAHPAFTPSRSVRFSETPSGIDELLERQFVFRLGRAGSVTGIVLNEKDEPIAGAEMLVGTRDVTGSRTAISRADGTFEIQGCTLGETTLSGSAKGFATTTIDINTTNAVENRVILKPGNLLRLLVTDRAGKPIEKAYVYFNTFGTDQNGVSLKIPQAKFEARTGADGRVVWEDAPPGDLSFDVDAATHMRAYGLTFQADGTEHRVVMQDALTISGTVRDADTGEPIPSFRVITGWPDSSFPKANGGKPMNTWSPIDRFWLRFVDGKYKHTFAEPPIIGARDPSFVFKFEADGYKSQESRIVKADEGAVNFDIRLKKDTALKLTVLGPDGKPSPRAAIRFLRPKENAILSGRSFVSAGYHKIDFTDAAGQIEWSQNENYQSIAAASADGFSFITTENLLPDSSIRLAPWGRLRGKITRAGQPLGGWKLECQSVRPPFANGIILSEKIVAGADGVFEVDSVPPVMLQVIRMVEGPQSDSGIENIGAVHIQPGTLTEFEYAQPSRAGMVRIVWPPSAPRSPLDNVFCGASIPLPGWRPELMSNAIQRLEWMNRPDVIAAQTESHSAKFVEMSPGLWQTENLGPGNWTIRVYIGRETEAAKGFGKQILRGERSVRIDEGTEPIDFGEIVLSPVPATSNP